MRRVWIVVVAVGMGVGRCVGAQVGANGVSNVMSIDATAEVVGPVAVAAKLGSSKRPDGRVIGVNSQYLTMDGKPWLPVMGEFHFSRYPAERWEEEILKMKAAGVQVVSSYVIWIHHEPVEGKYDWTGQNDLRRFVELCGKHGMYVYPRIGPWAHAEVRNGGFPDWVLKAGPVRLNDPVYLKEVGSFYDEIGRQLKGELWKDGGPVIGVQIENEYREQGKPGEGRGSEHIRTLKAMAIAAGMDVPLYTVTGWDGAAIPLDAVVPMFGGYADAPWDGSNKPEYGNEVYAFRFDNRVAGSMGAIGGRGQNAASSYKGTPFLTTEVGDGGQDTYFRRPVYSADDVAAVVPVMLGSGVNLLGYYMFHGGRNPEDAATAVGSGTLNEAQRTGGGTDTPVRSYDFQAPLGEFGQVRESLRKLKLVHYFLEDFGEELAPMAVRRPDVVPSGPGDTGVVRVSARTAGGSGFVFVNNYVRGLVMPERKGFQVRLRLAGGVVKVPETAIDLPAGAYGIWPVGLELRVGPIAGKRASLRYSTAQLFKRVEVGGEVYYFFFGIPGVVPELVLDAGTETVGMAGPVDVVKTEVGTRLRVAEGASAEVRLGGGVHLVVMPEAEAEEVWRGGDPEVLVKTAGDAYADGERWVVESKKPEMAVGVLGGGTPVVEGVGTVRAGKMEGVFKEYEAVVPGVELKVKVTKVAEAKARGTWEFSAPLSWRPQPPAMVPADAEYAGAAEWKIEVPKVPVGASVSDVWLRMRYQGDVARLYKAGALVDDSFWNGLPWEVGLREVGTGSFDLKVLPLPKVYPMYLERGDLLRFDGGVVGELGGVEVVPEYRVVVGIWGK
jgi:beta-galactosidase